LLKPRVVKVKILIREMKSSLTDNPKALSLKDPSNPKPLNLTAPSELIDPTALEVEEVEPSGQKDRSELELVEEIELLEEIEEIEEIEELEQEPVAVEKPGATEGLEDAKRLEDPPQD
jgi:hypothetical protein